MLVITLVVFVLPIESFVTLPRIINYKVPVPIETINEITQNNYISNIKQDDNKKVVKGTKRQKVVDKDDTFFNEVKTNYSISPVSYTHLTLPTILLVQISVVAVSLKKKKFIMEYVNIYIFQLL
eukprot:TRINITY_DN18546_c0_g1_i2.p2 TRINITY_DN18546_c0_g1~~TRINITY_DN18546_c0_g1_i2.p2  ORF type:complete len:137 (-),score=25.75 TRINITY_DN18546_c0_g1_i2:39-410(-)